LSPTALEYSSVLCKHLHCQLYQFWDSTTPLNLIAERLGSGNSNFLHSEHRPQTNRQVKTVIKKGPLFQDSIIRSPVSSMYTCNPWAELVYPGLYRKFPSELRSSPGIQACANLIGTISSFFSPGCNRAVLPAAPTRTASYSRSIKHGSVYVYTWQPIFLLWWVARKTNPKLCLHLRIYLCLFGRLRTDNLPNMDYNSKM
jgi:hypothetical protein